MAKSELPGIAPDAEVVTAKLPANPTEGDVARAIDAVAAFSCRGPAVFDAVGENIVAPVGAKLIEVQGTAPIRRGV